MQQKYSDHELKCGSSQQPFEHLKPHKPVQISNEKKKIIISTNAKDACKSSLYERTRTHNRHSKTRNGIPYILHHLPMLASHPSPLFQRHGQNHDYEFDGRTTLYDLYHDLIKKYIKKKE